MSMLRDTDVSYDPFALVTEAPEASRLSQRLFAIGLAGTVWLGVMIAVYLQFAAFVTVGPKNVSPAMQTSFTLWGRLCYRPERDIPIYALGCLFALLLSLGMARLWLKRFAAGEAFPTRSSVSEAALASNVTFSLVLGLAATLLNPIWLLGIHFFVTRKLRLHYLVELGLLVPLAAGELTLFLRSLNAHTQISLPRLTNRLKNALAQESAANATPRESGRVPSIPPVRRRWRDAIALLIIGFLAYIPRPDILAGNIYQSEHFHHWDYFAMAPAVGYLHGKALCTEIYSQYGIGWPLLFAKLDPIYRLSYGHLIQFANVYGCLYFGGVYLFFRVLLGSRRWALGGALLTMYYKLVAWPGPSMIAWQLPSITIMRSPFDIWFLLALLLHQRQKQARWLLTAGTLTGLALLFETDTGIYITFTFAVYCVLHLFQYSRRQSFALQNAQHVSPLQDAQRVSSLRDSRDVPMPQNGRDVSAGRVSRDVSPLAAIGAAWLLAGGALLSGMALASRGTLLSGAFWRGWIECFTLYPSGMSMTPVADVPDNVKYGMLMIGTFLFALSYSFLRYLLPLLRRDRTPDSLPEAPSGFDLLMICVALYGTCTMLHFIGRSNPPNLLVSALGFCLLTVYALYKVSRSDRACFYAAQILVPILLYKIFRLPNTPHVISIALVALLCYLFHKHGFLQGFDYARSRPSKAVKQSLANALLLLLFCYGVANSCYLHYPNLPYTLMTGARTEHYTQLYERAPTAKIENEGLFRLNRLYYPLSDGPPIALYPGSDVVLPQEMRETVEQFNNVVGEMRRLSAQHKRIAVIANDDTAYYLAADVPLWNKYSPLLPNLLMKKQLERMQQLLAADGTDYVFITPFDASETFVSWFAISSTDTWAALYMTARSHYTFDHQCGAFDVYRREGTERKSSNAPPQ